MVIDQNGDYGCFGLNTEPGFVAKVRLSNMTRVDELTLPIDEHLLYSAVIDSDDGFVYFGTGFNPDPGSGDVLYGKIIKIQPNGFDNVIGASKIGLFKSGRINTIRFYSHQAGVKLRLAIYDNGGATRKLLWQSASISNTTTRGWISIPIASGTPATLNLKAGAYCLAFNTDSQANPASYVVGHPWLGEGFKISQAFGTFPATLETKKITSFSGGWSMYLTTTPDFIANSAKHWQSYK